MSNATKNFDIPATSLNVLRNYFDSLKLFSDLYLANFLDISAKSLFSCEFRNLSLMLYTTKIKRVFARNISVFSRGLMSLTFQDPGTFCEFCVCDANGRMKGEQAIREHAGTRL